MSTLWPDPVPGAPYTARSLAQLALGVAAREASDYARSLVPTGARRATYDGTLLAGAVRLQELAQRVLECAIAVEREDGTDWGEIDDQLGGKVDARAVEQRWRDQLARAGAPGDVDDELPGVLLDDPVAVARRLDDWVLRHRESLDPIDGEHPVTDTLESMHPMLELMHLQEQQRRLAQDGCDPSAERLAALLEREALVHDALAASDPAAAAEHRDGAAGARARASELRGQAGPSAEQAP
jgi:hypothetical protein